MKIFNKRRLVIASSFLVVVLCGVIAVVGFKQYSAEGGTYTNTTYGTATTSPIPLVSPENAGMVLNTASQKTAENIGGYLDQSGLSGVGFYRSPLVDNGQTHALVSYNTPNNTAKLPPDQFFDLNLVTGKYNALNVDIGGFGHMLANPNGKIYFGQTNFSEYDPATQKVRVIHKIADNACVTSMNYVPSTGVIYIGEAATGHIERYDPRDDSYTDLGIMDNPKLRNAPAGDGTYRYLWYVSSPDDRYVYVWIRDQNEGHEVVGYDRLTNTTRVYWPKSSYAGVHLNRTDNKIYAYYTDANDTSGKRNFFTLNALDDPVPFSGTEPPMNKGTMPLMDSEFANTTSESAFGYSIDKTLIPADTGSNGQGTLKWRECKKASTCTNPWQSVTFNNILMAPAPISRAVAYSQDKLLVRGGGYGPYIAINPYTKKLTDIFGYDYISFYNALYSNNNWYFSGYAQLAFDQWDPSKPWVNPIIGTTYGDTNPIFLPIATEYQGKYNYYLAEGDDGTIYDGIHHERTDIGGSIAWYNPTTKETGGIREDFLNYDCRGLISALGGTKLVYSSLAVGDATTPKIFVIDTKTKKVEKSFDFTHNSHTGAMIEVEPGIILGNSGGVLYKYNITTNEMLWVKGSPEGTVYGVSTWNRQLVRGPDGFIWIYIGNDIYRIDPRDGAYQKVVSSYPAGILTFFNNDLYITGGTTIRRVSNLFVENSRGVDTDKTAPSAPSNLKAEAKDSTSINLSWSESTDEKGVTGYQIFRGETQIGATPSLTYTDSGLKASTKYSYTVKAYDAAGNVSNVSNEASATTPEATKAIEPDKTAPSAPKNLKVSASSSTASLTWEISTDNIGVTGYKIYRNNNEITTTVNLNYTDKGLSTNTEYSYIVKALDAAGNVSEASNEAKITTPSESKKYPAPSAINEDNIDSSEDNGNNSILEFFDEAPLETASAVATSDASESTVTDTATPAVVQETKLPEDLASTSKISENGAQKLNVKISRFWFITKIYVRLNTDSSEKKWHYELMSDGKKVKEVNYLRTWILSYIHHRPSGSAYLLGNKYDNEKNLRVVAFDSNNNVVAFTDLFKLK